MNYKQARALVVSPLFKGVEEADGVKHPGNVTLPPPVGNWGARFSTELYYEKLLNRYIDYYFRVQPDIGWTMNMNVPRGRK